MPIRLRKTKPGFNVPRVGTQAATQVSTPVPRLPPYSRKISRLNPTPAWSILVPTMPGRETKLARLLAILDAQLDSRRDVELLVVRDSRGMTIGEKRTRMIAMARGRYVSFVDDDDEVAADYVETIAQKLTDDPDVVCFLVTVQGHGYPRICHYHPSLENENLPKAYHRKPNHLMAWRRELALREPFPAIQTGEDTAWADRMVKHAIKVSTIDRSLYTYKFDPADNSGVNAVPRETR